jgi:hypothetical protein
MEPLPLEVHEVLDVRAFVRLPIRIVGTAVLLQDRRDLAVSAIGGDDDEVRCRDTSVLDSPPVREYGRSADALVDGEVQRRHKLYSLRTAVGHAVSNSSTRARSPSRHAISRFQTSAVGTPVLSRSRMMKLRAHLNRTSAGSAGGIAIGAVRETCRPCAGRSRVRSRARPSRHTRTGGR